MKYYIGLDAHSTTSTFAVMDENGQCVLRETVKTSEQSLVHVINRVQGERHMTFEESSISQWLYLHLKDKVDKLIICNPTFVAKKQGAKTDFRDALHLANELRTNHLQPVFHDTSHWMEIRTTVSGYLDIVEEIVRFKNRLKAVFRAEAIQTDENRAYHKIDSEKQKCWAHILRDLKNLSEKESNNLEIQYFSSRLKNFFDRGKDLRESKSNGNDVTKPLKRLMDDTEQFACRKFKHPELQTLAKRLIKYRREMYTFVEKNLEPTNNNAEREIRPAVLMRKTSYGNRSDQGRRNQTIMMSIIRTAHKRGQNFVHMAYRSLGRTLESLEKR